MIVKSELPYFEIQFDKEAAVHIPAQVKALKNALKPGDPTDLIFLSHGWNNDMDAARRVYQIIIGNFVALLKAGAPALAGRKFAFVGILWPARKFAEADAIPGGAASRGGVPDKAVTAALDGFKELFPGRAAHAKLKQAKALVPKLEKDAKARKQFADLIRGLLDKGAAKGAAAKEDASDRFFKLHGEDLLDLLKVPPPVDPRAAKAAAAGKAAKGQGGAASFGFFSDIKAAAMRFLNYTTYYEMKARAGKTGRDAVAPLVRSCKSQFTNLRVHLVGHSFGGRLVASATSALGAKGAAKALPIDSLSLLQAAFSHHGLSPQWEKGSGPGVYRNILGEKLVKGPIIITHTKNDSAVGTAYPLASRFARDASAALGDKNDKYGGMGRNGAQKTPEAVDQEMLAAGGRYDFRPGRIHNLLGDRFIRHHSDIDDKDAVYAVMSAIAKT